MSKQCLALIALLLTPAASFPQRYGRPYTLAENPQFLLEIKAQNKTHYFRVSDLHKMHRTSITMIDPATHASHVYEGVALDQLLPLLTLASTGQTIKIEFGSHQTLILSGIDLDPDVKLLVIDTVDGKPLAGSSPYYLFEKPRNKPLQTIADVRCITLQ